MCVCARVCGGGFGYVFVCVIACVRLVGWCVDWLRVRVLVCCFCVCLLVCACACVCMCVRLLICVRA